MRRSRMDQTAKCLPSYSTVEWDCNLWGDKYITEEAMYAKEDCIRVNYAKWLNCVEYKWFDVPIYNLIIIKRLTLVQNNILIVDMRREVTDIGRPDTRVEQSSRISPKTWQGCTVYSCRLEKTAFIRLCVDTGI